MTLSQRALRLTLHQRTALVTVDTARAVRGVDAESILAEIDDGRIPWVWDIAMPGADRRELRFWGPALEDPGTADQAEADVLASILGTTRPTLRGAEIEVRLLCSAPHVKRLHEAGELVGLLVGHTRHIRTDSLVAWLRRRRVS
jgi:hypothetical protein